MAQTGSLRPNVSQIDSGGYRARFLARRDGLVTDHLELVRQIARRIHASLPPSFEIDDLFAEGYRALTQAATRYRPDAHGGAPFSAYARKVIRGAILDSVTGRAYSENTCWTLGTSIEDANTPTLSRDAKPRNEGELPGRQLRKAIGRLALAPDASEAALDDQRRLARVAEAIERLPPRQSEVLREYYRADEPSLKTVAKRLRASYGVVWQLHAEAIRGLRELLDDEAA